MKNIISLFNWHVELENEEVDSIDDDFLLLENPIISAAFNYPFKVDVTTAIICLKGTMKGRINLKTYETQAPCLFIVLPDQILQYEYLSDDFSGLFIIMSKRFVNSMFMNTQERIPFSISVHKNPWTRLNDEDLKSMIDYYRILQKMVRMKDNPHRREIVKHLLQVFFYTSSYQFHKIPESRNKSKKEILVEEFLLSAQENFSEHRALDFYAEKLCLTPKYLSKVVREFSGSSASEWINNYVILEAKALLKSTNMTIQQISDQLNFPSQSFFGKYFKRHVGHSPHKYRNS
ncbi:helix-turn-helix domain-containing protein [Oceanispirochaeta sp.]|jgi:AraC family transcriptional activator of pobA|uniref:helix-turn-helix domain-containing protein n=1 Tax=Oceanispirochaeta sp. TaxID=2035350 RepID=UPI002623D74A|nr:helix-turn-helix domain-containing protein [Oceanispirochaeta sp.]MDA3955637.1 helix-turn-helix domain-containing protein [Oceanispirochaeta sp.]